MHPSGLSKTLNWDNLDFLERKIIIAVCFDGSPELARKKLKLNKQLFYSFWRNLGPLYCTLPGKIIDKLRYYGKLVPSF